VSERRDFVLNAPVGRALWSLAWPIALSNELSSLSISILVFWYGRLLGETGLVVESLFRPISSLVFWFFASASVGASVLVSRSVGAKDGRGMSIAVGSVTLTLALWVVVAVVAAPLSGWLADALSGDVPIERPMLQFLLGWLLVALPIMSVGEVLLDVANATGATRFNLVRVLVDLAVMAALVPIMVTVMGIAGGPVAEGGAVLVLVVVVWYALHRRRAELALGELEPRAWRIRWEMWREVLSVGLPMQLGRMAVLGSQVILVQRVMRDGAASVAGYGIALALLLFGVQATLGLAQASGILIGQSLGAGLHERARRGARTALLLGWLVISVFVGVTMFSGPIIGMFTSDPAIAAEAERALSIIRWASFGIATFQILLASFAAHRATVRASLLLVGGEVFGLVVAFSLPGSHLDAVCYSFVAASFLKAAFMLWLLAARTIERARA
jgi:Na+-driven multidrug efflux pump